MTAVIINPGSGEVPESGEGWTNTYAEARAEAARWLGRRGLRAAADLREGR